MSDELFMVAEDQKNATASRGPRGDGFSEANAKTDAEARNARAAKLGVKARYVVVPFVAAPKE